MILRVLFVFSLIIITGCTKKEQDQTVKEQQKAPEKYHTKQTKPVENDETTGLILLDAAHEMQNNQDIQAASYHIKPCEFLIVDHSYREFVLPGGQHRIGPRTVHLLRTDQSKYYRMIWKEEDNILLNNLTLHPRGNTGPFTRFRPGEEYFLAIGHDNFDEALPEDQVFQVMAMYRVIVMEQGGEN